MLKRLLFCSLLLIALVGCGGRKNTGTSSNSSPGSGSGGGTGGNWDSMTWDQSNWG